MLRRAVLVFLWFFVVLMIRAAHARHNITAALVALAPVSDTDVETSLNVKDKDGNAGSIVTINWILLSTGVILQFILLLLRWSKGPKKGKCSKRTDFYWLPNVYRKLLLGNTSDSASGYLDVAMLCPESSSSSVSSGRETWGLWVLDCRTTAEQWVWRCWTRDCVLKINAKQFLYTKWMY